VRRRGRRRIRPDGKGGFELRLSAPEQALLTSLPAQLDALLATLDPAGLNTGALSGSLARLLPPAYPRDADAEEAFARSSRPDLLASQREDLAALARVAEQSRASAEELEAACSAINDLRLVLGSALEVSEDPPVIDDADPNFAQWVCYGFLSSLQEEIVEVLSGLLPPPRAGADDEALEDPWGEPLGDLRWDGTPRPRR
jgi:hypothetical protein